MRRNSSFDKKSGISYALYLILFLFVYSSAVAQDCFTSLWYQLGQQYVHGNSMAYHAQSSSLLIPQVSDKGDIYVIDAATGNKTEKVLSQKGLPFGPLGCFAIGADDGGRIYGHNNAAPPFIALWSGVDDESPTSAPLVSARLARNYDMHGGGATTATIYAAGSADGGPIDVFTCEPNGVPILRETFGGDASGPGGKAGVAADSGYPASMVYGCDGVAGGYNGIHIWQRVEGVMTYQGELSIPGGFSSAPVLDLAYEPQNDGFLFALIGNSSPSCVMAINAKTYQMEGLYYIPISDAVGDRGALVLDRNNQHLYWYGRPKTSTATAPVGHWGCLAYTIPDVRPTPTPSPTPIPWENPDVEIRALWVTRWDFKTTDSVRLIMKNAADCNFNIILFQVRGNATTFYPSELEPWAWELTGSSVDTTGKDPGWDPLAAAIQEAHQYGMQLHAYMNTYPVWKETIPPPTDVPQLWNTHRDWFACGKDGATMWPSDWWTYWYAFLSPGHPQARSHIHAVYMEVLRNYPQIDGLHYDYFRYPSEVGDFSWNPTDVSLFTAYAGGTPDEKPSDWAQWKRDQISALARENYQAGEPIRRGTMFSSAVLGRYSSGRNTYFQDSHAWLQEGTIDCIMPMLYTSDIPYFESMVQEHAGARNGRFVAPGIGVSSVSVEGLLDEISISRNAGAQGVALFAYSTLFPSDIPNEKAKALIEGPFSNKAKIPPMTWKESSQNFWTLY